MSAVFLVFLAVLGFQVLDWVSTQGGERVDALPLPGRTGWTTEWGVGAAIGWGLCLMAVLPVLLTGICTDESACREWGAGCLRLGSRH